MSLVPTILVSSGLRGCSGQAFGCGSGTHHRCPTLSLSLSLCLSLSLSLYLYLCLSLGMCKQHGVFSSRGVYLAFPYKGCYMMQHAWRRHVPARRRHPCGEGRACERRIVCVCGDVAPCCWARDHFARGTTRGRDKATGGRACEHLIESWLQ